MWFYTASDETAIVCVGGIGGGAGIGLVMQGKAAEG